MKSKKIKKLLKIAKRVNKFLQQTKKNYQNMKKDILKILTCICVLICATACNVTRKVTTESSFFQKGDTTYTITTKTTESYDASKKMYYQPLKQIKTWK